MKKHPLHPFIEQILLPETLEILRKTPDEKTLDPTNCECEHECLNWEQACEHIEQHGLAGGMTIVDLLDVLPVVEHNPNEQDSINVPLTTLYKKMHTDPRIAGCTFTASAELVPIEDKPCAFSARIAHLSESAVGFYIPAPASSVTSLRYELNQSPICIPVDGGVYPSLVPNYKVIADYTNYQTGDWINFSSNWKYMPLDDSNYLRDRIVIEFKESADIPSHILVKYGMFVPELNMLFGYVHGGQCEFPGEKNI